MFTTRLMVYESCDEIFFSIILKYNFYHWCRKEKIIELEKHIWAHNTSSICKREYELNNVAEYIIDVLKMCATDVSAGRISFLLHNELMMMFIC